MKRVENGCMWPSQGIVYLSMTKCICGNFGSCFNFSGLSAKHRLALQRFACLDRRRSLICFSVLQHLVVVRCSSTARVLSARWFALQVCAVYSTVSCGVLNSFQAVYWCSSTLLSASIVLRKHHLPWLSLQMSQLRSVGSRPRLCIS